LIFDEKVEILLVRNGQRNATTIAERVGRPQATIGVSLSRWDKNHKTAPKRSRSQVGNPGNIADQIVMCVCDDPFQTLKASSAKSGLSELTLRKIRSQKGIHFYKALPVVVPKASYKVRHEELPRKILADEWDKHIIMSSGQSSIEQNRARCGLSCERGQRNQLTTAFYPCEAHKINVTV
jgi:hypothetical protein